MGKVSKTVGELNNSGNIYTNYMNRTSFDKKEIERLAAGAKVYVSLGEGDFNLKDYKNDLDEYIKERNELTAKKRRERELLEKIEATKKELEEGIVTLEVDGESYYIDKRKLLTNNIADYEKELKELTPDIEKREKLVSEKKNKVDGYDKNILASMEKGIGDAPINIRMTDERYTEYLFFNEFNNFNFNSNDDSYFNKTYKDLRKQSAGMEKDFDNVITSIIGREQLDYCIQMKMDPVMLLKIDGMNPYDYAYRNISKPEGFSLKDALGNPTTRAWIKSQAMLAMLACKDRVEVGNLVGINTKDNSIDAVSYKLEKLRPVKLNLKPYEAVEAAWYESNRKGLIKKPSISHTALQELTWSDKYYVRNNSTMDKVLSFFGENEQVMNLRKSGHELYNKSTAQKDVYEFVDKKVAASKAGFAALNQKIRNENEANKQKKLSLEDVTRMRRTSKLIQSLYEFDENSKYAQRYYNSQYRIARSLGKTGFDYGRDDISTEYALFKNSEKIVSEYIRIANMKAEQLQVESDIKGLKNSVKSIDTVSFAFYDDLTKHLSDKFNHPSKIFENIKDNELSIIFDNTSRGGSAIYSTFATEINDVMSSYEQIIRQIDRYDVGGGFGFDGLDKSSPDSMFHISEEERKYLDVNKFEDPEKIKKYLDLKESIVARVGKGYEWSEKFLQNSINPKSIDDMKMLFNQYEAEVNIEKLKDDIKEYVDLTAELIRAQKPEYSQDPKQVRKEYNDIATAIEQIHREEFAFYNKIRDDKLPDAQKGKLTVEMFEDSRKAILRYTSMHDMAVGADNKEKRTQAHTQLAAKMMTSAVYNVNLEDRNHVEDLINGNSDYMFDINVYEETGISRDETFKLARDMKFLLNNGMYLDEYIADAKNKAYNGLISGITVSENDPEYKKTFLNNVKNMDDIHDMRLKLEKDLETNIDAAERIRIFDRDVVKIEESELQKLKKTSAHLKYVSDFYNKNAEGSKADIEKNAKDLADARKLLETLTIDLNNLDNSVSDKEKDRNEKSQLFATAQSEKNAKNNEYFELSKKYDTENNDYRRKSKNLSDRTKLLAGELNTTRLSDIRVINDIGKEVIKVDDLIGTDAYENNTKIREDKHAKYEDMTIEKFLTDYQVIRANEPTMSEEEFRKAYPRLTTRYAEIFGLMDAADKGLKSTDEKKGLVDEVKELKETLDNDKNSLERIKKEKEEKELGENNAKKALDDAEKVLKEESEKRKDKEAEKESCIKNISELELKEKALATSKEELNTILNKNIEDIKKVDIKIDEQQKKVDEAKKRYSESSKIIPEEEFLYQVQQIDYATYYTGEKIKNDAFKEILRFVVDQKYEISDNEIKVEKNQISPETAKKNNREFVEEYLKLQNEKVKTQKIALDIATKKNRESDRVLHKEKYKLMRKDDSKDKNVTKFNALMDVLGQLEEMHYGDATIDELTAQKKKAEKLYNTGVGYASYLSKDYEGGYKPVSDGNREVKHKWVKSYQDKNLPVASNNLKEKILGVKSEVTPLYDIYMKVLDYRTKWDAYKDYCDKKAHGRYIDPKTVKEMTALEKKGAPGYDFNNKTPFYTENDLSLIKDMYVTLRNQEIEWMIDVLSRPYQKEIEAKKDFLLKERDKNSFGNKAYIPGKPVARELTSADELEAEQKDSSAKKLSNIVSPIEKGLNKENKGAEICGK